MAPGAADFFGVDLRRSSVEKFIFPTLRVGAIYSRKYLLGTAMARPLLATAQVKLTRKTGGTALGSVHGIGQEDKYPLLTAPVGG